MTKWFSVWLGLLFVGLLCTDTYGQLEDYKLYNLSREEGLPTENVLSVFQDSYGFLWIASFDGLFRWDGTNYKKYYTSQNDSSSISNNIIYVVFEDHKRRLWVGTLSGLDYYRRETDNFIRCPFDKTRRKIAVNAIVEDSKNQLWIGASSGLFRYDFDRRESTLYEHTAVGQGLADNVIFGMDIDAHDNLWLGTFHGGVARFSTDQKRYTSFTHSADNPKTICSNMIKTIMVDHEDNVWVGSYDKGITVLNNDGAVLTHYQIDPRNKIQNIISAIYEDKKHRIWVGATEEKLHYLNRSQGRLQPFDNSPNRRSSAHCESVSYIGEDSFDNLWFTTQAEGVFYTNKNKNVFEYYAYDDQKSLGLGGKMITSFYETRDGQVWIGTSGGLSVFDTKAKKFTNYTTKNGLSSNDVYDVKADQKGNLWIAAWGGGLSVYNISTRRFTSYLHDPGDIHSLNYNNIKSILPEDSVIWIGTHGEGLAMFDIRRNKFIHAGNNTTIPFDMGEPAWINHLMRDSKKRLWISTYNGVFVFDRSSLRHFTHSEERSSLSSNAVNMTMEDAAGRIWALTERGGVDLFNEQHQDFFNYYRATQGAKAFTIDQGGTMWISSNEGIQSVDLVTKLSKTFDASDGLIRNSFFHKSVLNSSSGQLFFGSNYGFNVFHPDSIKAFTYKSDPYLTSFFLYDSLVLPKAGSILLDKVLNFTDTIVLSYKQNFIAIGYTVPNLLAGDKTQFSVKLEGLHDDWINQQGERKASFTNLDPGTYIFKLRYTDAPERWVESGKYLVIIVEPPWWLTIWFKVIAFVFVVSAIILIFYIRLNAIRRRTKYLEDEVARRTHDLSEANYFLTERNGEINRQSKKILTQQEQILVQNQKLEKSVDEGNRLNQVKDRFFSILAHDLRNPIFTLSRISDNLKISLQGMNRREIERHVDSLQRSAMGIHNLLTNLLQWGATHTHAIENSPVDFVISEVVRNNAQLLEPQFQQKNITLTIMVHSNHKVFADVNMVDTVVRNILTNSVKFTYPQGEVVVESTEMEEEIIIKITDNGMGMTRDQIENVFNIEKQGIATGTSGETGTGLGLIISREFVEANKGSISLISAPGKGSSFSVRLPKSRSAKKDDPECSKVVVQDRPQEMDDLPIEDLVKIRGKKILIVEDNQELRKHLQLYLSSTFEIFDAPNGSAGLSSALEIQPAVIISDLSMPVMDGIEFCKRVKNDPVISHIPFLLLTSHSSDESQLSGYNAGADVYLTKPVKKRLLFQVIFNAIERQEKIRHKMLDSNGFLTDDPIINKSDQEFLGKVVDIIEANMDDPNLDFKTITDGVAMSRTVVYNKIKSITGLGIQELIKSIRLKKSLKYLIDGKLAVNQIALMVGFSSQSYFNKCFIKEFQMTPKAYMNKNKKPVAT